MSDLILVADDVEVAMPAPPQGGYVAKQCEHAASLDHDPLTDDELKEPHSEATLQRMREGIEFEADIEERLRIRMDPDDVVFLEGDRTKKSKIAREQATIDAMDRGVRAIWNARLPADLDTSRISEPDLLVRVGNTPKANGKWAYTSVDVKHHKPLSGDARPVAWMISDLAAPFLDEAVERQVGPGRPSRDDSVQLAHYHRHLEDLGYALEVGDDDPVLAGIIGKTGVVVWRDIADSGAHLFWDRSEQVKRRMSALDIYDQEFAVRLAAIRRAKSRIDSPELNLLTFPEWKSECVECPWRTLCHDQLVDEDHITLVQGVTPERARAHYDQGITKTSELARLDWKTATLVDAGLDVEDLRNRALEHGCQDAPAEELAVGRSAARIADELEAKKLETVGDIAALHDVTAGYSNGNVKVSRLADMIDQARVAKASRVFRKRGVDRLEIPTADIELDVDMENDPGGLIYLWGTHLRVAPRSGLVIPNEGYRPFVTWETGDAGDVGEASALAQLWSWMQALIALAEHSGLSFRAYYYTPAENRCLRSLARKHAGRPGVPTLDEVEDFIESDYWVDLHRVVTEPLLWPTENLGLKALAKYARHSWRDQDAGGDNSVTWYRDAIEGRQASVREEARQRLLDYNEDDVIATLKLRDFLGQALRAHDASKKIPSVASLERRFKPRGLRARRKS